MRRMLVSVALVAFAVAPSVSVTAQQSPNPQAERDLPSGLREGSHHVVVNDVRLWYRVAGASAPDTPPVVFLHGGPGGSSHDFATLMGPRLEPALRMIYLDQRGSGRSERPWDDAYSLELLVEDLEGLRRALGVPKMALVGHSFGGLLALEYASRHPEHVSRLVFVAGLSDAAASGRSMCQRLSETDPDAYARAVEDSAGSAGGAGCNIFRALSGKEREAFFSANMYPDSTVRRLRDSVVVASGLRNTQELSRALFRAGLGNYRFTAHERVTMPVLIIVGKHDYQVGMEAPKDLLRRLPQAQLLAYERSGHHLYLDEPGRFRRDVTNFLAAPAGMSR